MLGLDGVCALEYFVGFVPVAFDFVDQLTEFGLVLLRRCRVFVSVLVLVLFLDSIKIIEYTTLIIKIIIKPIVPALRYLPAAVDHRSGVCADVGCVQCSLSLGLSMGVEVYIRTAPTFIGEECLLG